MTQRSATDRLERALADIAAGSAEGAWWHLDAAGARAAAGESDRRIAAGDAPRALEGALVGVKANIAVRGWPLTAGLAFRNETLAAQDAAMIARLRAAGAILLGSTAMDEAALGATGLTVRGPIRNPKSPGHSAGGSSGGSAAAVASGSCDFALGTDTLGSVRIPAAFCGVLGFKPTHGTIDDAGVVPVHAAFDHVGVLASGFDTMLRAMRVLTDQFDAADTPASIAGRKLAYASDLAEFGSSDLVRRAYARALDALRTRGASLTPLAIQPLELPKLRRAIFTLCEHALWQSHRERLARAPEEFSPTLQALLNYGGTLAQDKLDALSHLVRDFKSRCDAAMQNCEGLLLPTTPDPPFDLAQAPATNLADLTALASALGAPALSIPASQRGEPIGLQLVGHRGADRFVLDLGRELAAGL